MPSAKDIAQIHTEKLRYWIFFRFGKTERCKNLTYKEWKRIKPAQMLPTCYNKVGYNNKLYLIQSNFLSSKSFNIWKNKTEHLYFLKVTYRGILFHRPTAKDKRKKLTVSIFMVKFNIILKKKNSTHSDKYQEYDF